MTVSQANKAELKEEGIKVTDFVLDGCFLQSLTAHPIWNLLCIFFEVLSSIRRVETFYSKTLKQFQDTPLSLPGKDTMLAPLSTASAILLAALSKFSDLLAPTDN